MKNIIRVLIVDDSAYVRKVIRQMLSRSPFIEVVDVAHDGADALDKIERLGDQVDVVTLDLLMPKMDGVEFIKHQMARRPLPVIVVSIANEGGEKFLAALDAGAVDFVHKPTALATEKMFDISDELIAKVKTASTVPIHCITNVNELHSSPPLPRPPISSGKIELVAIGISTGGPQALAFLIPQLPENLPVPVVVVLHMPVGYTNMYAQRLNRLCSLDVKEAQAGDLVRPGEVLIAQAGHHLSFKRNHDQNVVVRLHTKPFDLPHRPSVDVMFQSAAEIYKERVLGVVMTGMGSDGKQGAAWIKSHGGSVFTEAEESCVVYGMPRTVVEAGLSDRSIPLNQMAKAIVDYL